MSNCPSAPGRGRSHRLMRGARAAAACFLFLAVRPAAASAPVAAPPKSQIASMTWDGVRSPVERILQLRAESDWNALQRDCQDLIGRFEFKAPFDRDRDYVRLVIVHDAVSGEPELVSILTHPGLPSGSAETLPGIRERLARTYDSGSIVATDSTKHSQPAFYECLVTDNIHATIASEYTYEETSNELLGKLAAFLKENLDLSLLAPRGEAVAPGAVQKTLYARLRPIPVPFARADIGVKTAVSLPPVDGVDVRDRVGQVEASALLRLARPGVSDCAPALARSMATRLKQVPYENATTSAELGASVDKALDGALEQAAASGPCAKVSLGEWSNALRIEDDFRVALRPQAVTGEWKLKNAPLERWGLGVMTAIALQGGEDRVQIDAGKIVADPLSGVLAIAAVDWHPVGYSPELVEPSWAERFKFWGGAVVVPDLGIVAGAAIMPFPVRGFTLDAGGGWLRMRELRPGYTLTGSSLPTTDAADQATRWAMKPILIVGIEYAF